MLDTTRALADIARQVRAYRSADGLSLQQLATRSGVAASTIHKVESRQMVPTVVVLLKIAKGLGRRPEELIRDDLHAGLGDGAEPAIPADGSARGPADAMPGRGGREAVAARAALPAGADGAQDGGRRPQLARQRHLA